MDKIKEIDFTAERAEVAERNKTVKYRRKEAGEALLAFFAVPPCGLRGLCGKK